MTRTPDLEARPDLGSDGGQAGPGPRLPEPAGRLDVRLLGVVEVRRDGVPVPVPSGRPAVILAALALRPGAVVSQGTLTRLIWPVDQPEHPRAALQTNVARLRAVLGRDAVESAGDGYRLGLPPDVVDVGRFRSLFAAARAAADPADELALLDQALALWRGNPLAGLWPDVLARQTAPSLLDEVLTVAEQAHEVRLRLHGPDDGLVRQLRELVAAHPHRERAAGQLMLALTALGRQGDALAVFNDTVRALRALGRRPGADLAGQHQRVLTGTSDPAGTAGRAATTGRAAPAGRAATTGRAAASGPAATAGRAGTAGAGAPPVTAARPGTGIARGADPVSGAGSASGAGRTSGTGIARGADSASGSARASGTGIARGADPASGASRASGTGIVRGADSASGASQALGADSVPGAGSLPAHRPSPGRAPERPAPVATTARAEASAVTPAEPPRPAQLPARPPSFVGRTAEVAELTAALRDGPDPDGRCRTVVVSGPGGTGKTTLALRVAHEVRDRYPDGQLFADLRTSGDAAALGTDALAGLLRALGVGGSDLPPCPHERAELFRRMCAGRRLLVLMDDADPGTVASLLPPGAGSAVIVTSRRRVPDLPADARVDLGMFSEPEARELLASVVGPDRLAAEPEATSAVLERCAGSPLAVRIAAGRLATRPAWPIGHFAGRLRDGDRLGELRAGGLAVRTMLDATYLSLQPVQAQRYRLLAAMPGATVDPETAAVLWDVDVAEARRLLTRLADIRLVEPAGCDWFGWHDLVDDHVRAVADAESAGTARHRLLGHLLLSLRNARLTLRPADRVPGVPELPRDCPGGRSFADRCEIHAWLHPRRTLLVSLARIELARGEYPAVDHAAGMLVLLDAVARECCDSGDDEETARTVLRAAAQPSDPAITAAAWTNLTLTLAAQHRLDEALEAAGTAIALRRELGDRYGELIMFENQACIYVEAGRHQDAVDVIGACVDDRELLSPQVRARCLRTRARAYAGLGRCADARADLAAANAVETPRPVSYDAHYEAAVTTAVHRAAGEREPALRSCRQAVEVAVALGSTWMQALSLLDTARTLRHFGSDGSGAAADAVAVAVENRHVRLAAEARVELTLAAAGR